MAEEVGYKGRFGKESALEFLKRDDWYETMFITHGDPRTTNLLWLRTPETALIIIAAYILFVWLAPRYMANRPAFNLKPLIIIYNFAMVALSAYMCTEFFLTSTSLGYSYFCQGVDWSYPTDPVNMRLVNVHWLFFMSKIIELADTVFFILRKKDNQVTFLHVYHHATMIVNWWLAAKYIPVGQSFFVGMINSWIHTLMYVYYALAALGPSMQKYLWWKKHMTTLQLVQFIAVISHTSYNKFVRTDCDYPSLYNTIVFYYAWSMVILFSHFFYTAYVRTAKRPPHAGTKIPPTTNGYYSGEIHNGSGDHRADNNNVSNGSGISHRKKV